MTSDTVNEVAIDLSSAATGSASTTTSNATVTNSASPTTNCVSIVTDEYHVISVYPNSASTQRYICSWEPRFKLKDDSFEEEMGLADRWKALSVSLFETFWRKMMLAWDCLGR
ncbi:hypothetical protein PPTG_17446 [Phytophthora nicotianae INRA-310]|uniref:Uncharacterized protein n=1 Tax=Phytophthora nicotianae (strain INRA-310) TaxID=761204 RepID=W2PMU3_PHYN3|nr:hypothetical protein PPTG_17446 [Phytophthora nicotianae INRA-310]ETN01335.1 hypothetical protein PPTG_17446 [Phytophthora nicotianae INRA-310]